VSPSPCYTGTSEARDLCRTTHGGSDFWHELRLCDPRFIGHSRVHRNRRRRAVFLGTCFASGTSIERILTDSPDPVTAADRLGSLAGSYCVFVTEGPELAWAGDLAGTHRLWFRQGEHSVRFASSPISPSLTPTAEPETEGIAAFLFLPDLTDVLGICPVQGVSQVGPHQVLHVNKGRAALRQRNLPVPEASLAEGAALLRSALLQTLQNLCGNAADVSCDLSGGLNSSTLAVLAASYAGSPVVALTYTDGFAHNGDDLTHAERIVRQTPGLDWTVIEGGQSTLPFSGLAQSPETDVPSLDPLIWARTRVRLRPATREGVHLVGDGGDVVLGAPLTYLSELARMRHGRRFLAEAHALARLRQRPVHRVVRAGLSSARTGFRAVLADLADHLYSPGWRAQRLSPSPELEAGISWIPVGGALRWATDAAIGALAERARLGADALGPEQDGADAHALRMVHRHGEATRSFLHLAELAGVRARAPYFDNSVVAACLSVPAGERATALNAKPLLGRAMEGLVPATLYERRSKDDYGACEYHGLRHNAAEARALLREGHLLASGIVRPDPVLRDLDLAVAGGRAPMAALHRILAAELWLRSRRNNLPTPRTESAPIPIGVMA
jgi:asparagine synthase (glutamine-hydrolysing)